MLDGSTLPNHEASERVWVVRASGGQFVRHFKKAEIIAIGHLDMLDLAPEENAIQDQHKLSLKETAKQLTERHDLAKATVTSHISQVEKFCREMKCGDLVVTVDSSSIAIGRIAGFPFFDRTPVDLSTPDFKDDPMAFHLRRSVRWGPTYPRSKLPLPLERVFNTHRTVFEITKHWDLVYHLLYPVFTQGDEVHVSLQVRKQDDIKNTSLVQLLLLLKDFEELSARFGGDALLDSLTIQAGFFSPGDIWPKLKATEKKKLFYALCIVLLAGGGEVGEISIGPVKFGPLRLNGGAGAIKQLMEGAAEIISKHGGQDVVKELQIQIPQHDTSPLDSPDRAPVNTETILLS